jgi:hypothetical protein
VDVLLEDGCQTGEKVGDEWWDVGLWRVLAHSHAMVLSCVVRRAHQ